MASLMRTIKKTSVNEFYSIFENGLERDTSLVEGKRSEGK